MTPDQIGAFVGALGITFLISRLFLWLLKRQPRGVRLATAHLATLALVWVLSAVGHADGDPLAWNSGTSYVVPVIIWMAVDFLRTRHKAA